MLVEINKFVIYVTLCFKFVQLSLNSCNSNYYNIVLKRPSTSDYKLLDC